MADNLKQILPQNFSVPTPPPIPKGNVSSLVNPGTLSNLVKSKPPKTFGDQVLNTATQMVIQAATESTIARLYKLKADLIQEGIKLEIDHQLNLQKLEQKKVPAKQVINGVVVDIPAKLTEEQYQFAVLTEEKNYERAKENLQERKDKNQKDIDDYLKDPFKKQKDEYKKYKEKRKQQKKRTKAEKRKARKERAKKIFKNVKKTIVPILTLVLTNKIAEVIAQNDKIKKLVTDTNDIITEANASGDSTKLNNARLARDNAIKIIQDNENKLIKIKDQIQRIQTYINIFTVIVNIISAIPIPTSVPPGVGIPVNLIMKFVKILDKANRIILELSALIPILISVLEKAIDILENYKLQLLQVNAALEKAAITQVASSNNGTSPLLEDNQDIKFGSFPTEYKGFKFAIREENNPKFNIRGNKRHYAVAIDVNNVEVLKSELSFTLDPNDLIDQLKLIIDREKLIAGAGRGGTLEERIESKLQNPTEETPESINSLINNSTAQIRRQQDIEKQKQKEELEYTVDTRSTETAKNVIRTGEVRPPLTSQQKRYYENIVRDINQPLYERQNAQNILKRNYI